MGAPPETTEAPVPPEVEERQDCVEVCLFDESPEGFSRAVRAISELTAGEPQPVFPEAEVERLASSVTFLREWRHFSYEPKGVSFTNNAGSASREDTHKITLPQFSSASVPQINNREDEMDGANSSDFILFSGGNVWALEWCPRSNDKPCSPVNCEYLAVAAHPPDSSYHKLGMPLTGRGLIQIWCLVTPFEEVNAHQRVGCNKNGRRGRPRKTPDENNHVGSSYNPPKPRGRPKKKTITTSDCHLEPSLKRPRGRPRKYPLPVANMEDSSQMGRSQYFSLIDPPVTSTVVPGDLAPACLMPTLMSVKPTPRNARGRPRKQKIGKIKGPPCIELKEDISTALICMEPKKKRGRPRKHPAPSNGEHVELGKDRQCEGNVPTVGVSDDSVLPMRIYPKSSDKRESNCMIGRGRPGKKPLLSATGCLLPSGTESPKTASILTNPDNPMPLAICYGKTRASNLDSIDTTSPVHGLCNANCKEQLSSRRGRGRPIRKSFSMECTTQTTPNFSDNVVSVEKGGRQLTKESVPNENNLLAPSEARKMEISSTCTIQINNLASFDNPMLLRLPVSEDMSNEDNLIGSKSGVVGGMKVNGSNTANDSSNCDIEHAQKNEIMPVPFENTSQVIDEAKDTEVALSKELIKNVNTNSSAENSNLSTVPKDISLPRVVLCLAHNGKVAWDIKWKPPLLCQSEQRSRLGFLAILSGNGSLEVWEVPSPSMIQSIYSFSSLEGTDPRFLKLQPVFRCASVKCGNRQSIPLTVDWSPSPPHDMILAGCHDGTIALWKFTTNLSSEDSKPLMCITAESVPIRALSWAPYVSGEDANTFVTAGEDGLKFWDLRDPYRPLWELTTAPRAVLSLHWLKDARGIVISLEDGTLKFLSLSRMANDVPVTGRPFHGTKTQGISTYQLSEYVIWSVHASEITGYAAYCVADGTAVRFQLTSRFWEKEPGRNRVPYFLCGSVSEEKTVIKVGATLQQCPLLNVPLAAKKGSKSLQDVDQGHDIEKEKLPLTDSGYNCTANPDVTDGRQDGHDQGQSTGAIVLAGPAVQYNAGIYNISDGESPENFEVFPPKAVALHRLRWNMNKGSERWLCYGGAAGIIRCQRI